MAMEGIREVHAWDPDIISVVFLSFHPYEHEQLFGEEHIPFDEQTVEFVELIPKHKGILHN